MYEFKLVQSGGHIRRKVQTAKTDAKKNHRSRTAQIKARANRYEKLRKLKKPSKKRGYKGAAAHKAGVAKTRTLEAAQKKFDETVEKRDLYDGLAYTPLKNLKGIAGVIETSAKGAAWAAELAGKKKWKKTLGKIALGANVAEQVLGTAAKRAKAYTDQAFEEDKGRVNPTMEPTWTEWLTGSKSAKEQLLEDEMARRQIGSGRRPKGGAGKNVERRLTKANEKKAAARAKRYAALRAIEATDPDHLQEVREMKRARREYASNRRKKQELKTEYEHGTKYPKGMKYDLNTAWGMQLHELERKSKRDEEDDLDAQRRKTIEELLEDNNTALKDIYLAQMSSWRPNMHSGGGYQPPPPPPPTETFAPSIVPTIAPTIAPTLTNAIGRGSNTLTALFRHPENAATVGLAAATAAALSANQQQQRKRHDMFCTNPWC
jgi:hypothetical protein